jgi:hypothetical protein
VTHRHRVHREHLAARRHQRGGEQAPIGLDPDHHLAGLPRMPGGQLVEPGDALHTLGQTPAAQPCTLLILHVHVIVGLSPVHPDEDQSRLLPVTST